MKSNGPVIVAWLTLAVVLIGVCSSHESTPVYSAPAGDYINGATGLPESTSGIATFGGPDTFIGPERPQSWPFGDEHGQMPAPDVWTDR